MPGTYTEVIEGGAASPESHPNGFIPGFQESPEATLCSGLYSAASSVTGRAGEMRSRFCGAWRLWLGLPGRGEEVP